MTETHALANPETASALFAQWRPYWDLAQPYLVEKTPITLLRTRLFQALFPNSCFVVIVRHPLAVALATYNALASSGAAPDLTIADLVEHWCICHEVFLADAPHLQRLKIVKYEDFVSNPQSTLDAIYAFLGLPAHFISEEIEPDSNTRYQAQWHTLCQNPEQQSIIEQVMGQQSRTQVLGYSLGDWNRSGPKQNISKVGETL